MMLGLSYSRVAASTAVQVDEDRKYVTDAQVEVLENTSGTNTGDNAINTQYSGLDGLKANLTGATFTGTIID
jgi:thiazole synthase ThiGH ThiG subunit